MCEILYQWIISICTVVAFIYGYYSGSFYHTFLGCVAGLLFTALVCIPDWPFYNRAPLKFITPEQPIESGVCGTCACGTVIHGTQCENYPGKKDADKSSPTSPPSTTESSVNEVEMSEGKGKKKQK